MAPELGCSKGRLCVPATVSSFNQGVHGCLQVSQVALLVLLLVRMTETVLKHFAISHLNFGTTVGQQSAKTYLTQEKLQQQMRERGACFCAPM